MSERFAFIFFVAVSIAIMVYFALLQRLEVRRDRRYKEYPPAPRIRELWISLTVFISLVVVLVLLDIRTSPNYYPEFNDNLESLTIEDTCDDIIKFGYQDKYGLIIYNTKIFTAPQHYDGYRYIYLVIHPLQESDILWVSKTELSYYGDYWESYAFLPGGKQVEVFAIASFNRLNSDTSYPADILNNKELIVSNILNCNLPEYTESTIPEPYVTEFPAANALSKDKPIGDVRVIFPQWMNPNTTDFVSLTISVPVPQPVFNFYKINVEPVDVTRVEVSPDSSNLLDYQQNKVYLGTIRVADRMKAQLESINLTIAPRQNPIQTIYFENRSAETTWFWEIGAPNFIGKQNFTISVWADGHNNPIWRGNFEIEVIGPTALPTHTSTPTNTPSPTATVQPTLTATLTPTYTPTPSINEKIERDIENSPLEFLKWLIPIIIAFLVAAFGVVIRYLLRSQKIKRLENKIRAMNAKLQQQILKGENRDTTLAEIRNLENKIEQLKEIRWYELLKDIKEED